MSATKAGSEVSTTSIIVSDPASGSAEIGISASGQAPTIQALSSSGSLLFNLLTTDNGVGLQVYDTQGNRRIFLGCGPDGTPSLLFFNAEGQVTNSLVG